MFSVRVLKSSDWEAVREIYLEGIATGHATFETGVPEWEIWDQAHFSDLRYVAIDNHGTVAGWATLAPVSGRHVYRGVAEVSIYVGANFRNQKAGELLLSHLIRESEKKDYWTLQASIFEENIASINLHKKHDFRIVGYREKLAEMHKIWRHVNLLERRSKIVGINE